LLHITVTHFWNIVAGFTHLLEWKRQAFDVIFLESLSLNHYTEPGISF